MKITAARDLTLANILHECRERKGIGMVGIIDAATAGGLHDLERLLATGELVELGGGGLSSRGEVTLIPGAEVEVLHRGRPVHLACYLPGARELREFSAWQRERVKNSRLSTQRHRGTAATDVVATVAGLGGLVIPAHIFTPHKGTLGAAGSIAEVIDPALWGAVPAVELGLSSDTALAGLLPELSAFAFVSNSDAHSLGKIAREYNRLRVAAPTFAELGLALREQEGRRVDANFGLDPRLGKYHRTYCLVCDRRLDGAPPATDCPDNPAHRLVEGVLDRICRVSQAGSGAGIPRVERRRPPYIHQVPLQFVPGLGPKALDRLLAAFGTEMDVLHRTPEEALSRVIGPKRAALVAAARTGRLAVQEGGGGVYGRVLVSSGPGT